MIELLFYIGMILVAKYIECSSSIARKPDIKKISSKSEFENVKSNRNGSIILFEKIEEVKMQENLFRAYKHVSKYGIKLRKVNCKQSSIKQCRTVEDYMVSLYKQGEEKTLHKDDLVGTRLTVNSILFFMASAHFDMLVPCGDMNQVREVLDMDKKIMNTVLGCFSDHGSEYLRRFLETAMEYGRTYGFVLLSGNAEDRDKFGKQGFYVTFYNTLNPSRNGDFKTADLTEYLERSANDFQYMIKTYEITDNMKHHAKTMVEAKKKQAEMEKEMKEKAMNEMKKKQAYQFVGEEDRELAEEMFKSTKGNPKYKDYLKLTDNIFLNRVKREESEIGYDAFRYVDRENRLTFRKTKFVLNTTEFHDAVNNVNKSKEHVLMVLFFVPWDPVFHIFQNTYYKLAMEKREEGNIQLVSFDCWSWPDVCKDYGILNYPNTLVFRSGLSSFSYDGFLDTHTINEHLELYKYDFLPDLTDVRQLDDISKNLDELVVFGVFTRNMNRDKAKNFEKIALKYYGKVRIARLTIKKKEFKYGNIELTTPCVISLNSCGRKQHLQVTYDFNDDLISWIDEQRQADVEELTPLSLPRLLRVRKPFLIAFRSRSKDQSSLRKFSKRNPQVITTWMDIEASTTKEIQKSYNLKRKQGIALLDKLNNIVYEYTDEKQTIENISKWVARCLSNETKPTHILPSITWPGQKGYDFLEKLDHLAQKRNNITSPNIVQKENDELKSVTVKKGRIYEIAKTSEKVKNVEVEIEENEEDLLREKIFRHYDEL